MSKDNEQKNAFWQAIYDEVKPFENWPNDAATIAHNLCQWRSTRNFYYINQVKNHLLKNNIKLTPIVEALLAEGDQYLQSGRSKGSAPRAKRDAHLEDLFLFMANLMFDRKEMTLALASQYAAAFNEKQLKRDGTDIEPFKASSLERWYSADYRKTGAEKMHFDYLRRCEPAHYDEWSETIQKLSINPILEGTAR